MVKYLLTRKADVNMLGGPKHQTVLHFAVSRPNTQAVQVLKELLPICSPDMKLVQDREGNIPLFVAIEVGNFNACKALLAEDAEDQIKQLKVA